jgi:16S rRNA (cytosine1402-N4)-methyltransferase
MKPPHQPVLLAETMRLLNPQLGESYLDLTGGYGGHASAVLGKLGPKGRAVIVERDAEAVRWLQKRLKDRALIVHTDYLNAAEQLYEDGSLFDMILLDLGVSSPQLDDPVRGFSFKVSGLLDMRMDQTCDLTAAAVVNTYSLKQLEKIIREYGEERKARRVARAIIAARPLASTGELAAIVRQEVGYSGDIDPATRTFQAIRIEVNAELDQLQSTLTILPNLLTPGGRLAIISFHSLEDRLVKNWLKTESRDCICPPVQPICTCGHQAKLTILTKKPLTGKEYDALNPRARSAKLRAAAKIKTKGG